MCSVRLIVEKGAEIESSALLPDRTSTGPLPIRYHLKAVLCPICLSLMQKEHTEWNVDIWRCWQMRIPCDYGALQLFSACFLDVVGKVVAITFAQNGHRRPVAVSSARNNFKLQEILVDDFQG